MVSIAQSSDITKPLRISEELDLDLNDTVGKFIAVLGIRGSGKTNTAAVILEELLNYNFPLTIVDIDGEYWGLKEKYEILVVGKSENVDIEIGIQHAEKIAEISLAKNVPIILDVSGYAYDEAHKLLLLYFRKLWDLAGKFRKPYEIVIEEAHEFIPQGISDELKRVLVRIALRGRKRGLGAIILSQRSAKVEKDVLTQAEILFLHKVVHPSDLKVYKDMLPVAPKNVSEIINALSTGECVFYCGEVCTTIQIRIRKTFHAGYTPALGEIEIPKLKSISEEILDLVRNYTNIKTTPLDPQIPQNSLAELESLKELVEEKNKTIRQLSEELHALKLEHQANSTIDNLPNGSTRCEPLDSEQIYDKNSFKGELPLEIVRHIELILKRINGLSRPEREMFRFLLIKDQKEYSYKQIASWIKYSVKTLHTHSLKNLVEIGLVNRRHRKDGYYFCSNFDTFVEKEFGSDNVETELMQNIKLHLKSKIL